MLGNYHSVMGLPARDGPGLGLSGAAQTLKPMLLISSSHEKQTRLLEIESFMSMNHSEEASLSGIFSSVWSWL